MLFFIVLRAIHIVEVVSLSNYSMSCPLSRGTSVTSRDTFLPAIEPSLPCNQVHSIKFHQASQGSTLGIWVTAIRH